MLTVFQQAWMDLVTVVHAISVVDVKNLISPIFNNVEISLIVQIID